ncbi:DUF72 domain-containing protein [Mumia sp. zg.B17]|uniref:DUF72 domain-containing protein n=1 Tax=Mumia sp. zg.B17 TaxID=2855446 RepID=UPI001C6EAFF3|nr:DUF72 domain-containing protein [Mumia sp. zg.B17]MBW9204993.1 DUF72 domain-containing protein [Mumia sp. zg.B17]
MAGSRRVRVGISGWSYGSWRGDFYPRGLRQADELAYVAQRMDTAEVNASFYRLQRPTTYARWYEATPKGFRFAVKGSRLLTHLLRLRDAEQPLATFLASGVLALREKIGPLLWQLPARGAPTPESLDAFCSLLPRTYGQAVTLARRHGPQVGGDRVWLPGAVEGGQRPIQHAVEVRTTDGLDEVVEVLRRHRVALVVSDGAGRWPIIERPTASFAYVRLHGHTDLYHGGYSVQRLRTWADRIRSWDQPTWVYFDNDADGRAPYDAVALGRILG